MAKSKDIKHQGASEITEEIFDWDKILKKLEQKTYCKSYLLKKGWTKKSIEELLPPPEHRQNPYHKSAPYMKIWYEDDIREAEKTEEFKSYQKKKARYQLISQKALETKKKKILEMVDTFSVEVQKIDFEIVKKMNIRNNVKNHSNVIPIDINICEFILNYLTDFQINIKKLEGKTYKNIAIRKYESILRKKIYEVYPEIFGGLF